MKLSFHGGAREVTGSCYLLETEKVPRPFGPGSRRQSRLGTKILVDCGLFQGTKECEDLNFEPFKFNPKEIDFVLVTHAHLDHIGRIPKLVKDGFEGKIYSTLATRDLAFLLLEDALDIARKEDKVLYEENDLEKTKKLWEDAPYYKTFDFSGVKFQFFNAGHILGSAFIQVLAEKRKILFSGDMGNSPSELLPTHDAFKDTEYLVIESTYGNKTHEPFDERRLKLERAVEDAASRGGTLMIPAFATERTQEILHYLNEMVLFKRIPPVPVFVDAPLAIKATKIFEKYPDHYNEHIRELYLKHPNLFRFKTLKFTETVEESKSINDVRPPKVVIAGSGMMSGGRILHHARRYLSDSSSILLITGYQAAGSLGRRLIDGANMVKLFGEEIPVKAEIRQISGFSAHADEPQLFSFVEHTKDTLKRVFVVQGEEPKALYFMQEVKDRLGIQADAPTLYQEFEI